MKKSIFKMAMTAGVLSMLNINTVMAQDAGDGSNVAGELSGPISLNIPKEDAYETLGGFIINHTESIPEQDEEIQVDNFKIKIIKVGSTKIDSIHLEVLPQEA